MSESMDTSLLDGDVAVLKAAERQPADEAGMRQAQDLLFFAYRDFTNAADIILEELGLGRAHHRALHFIGGNPDITVSDLLSILRITKQSLARVLGALVEQGYVAQAPGPSDRRQRLLSLTQKGQALERRLFERQRQRLEIAYDRAGSDAVDGFRQVMRGIMDDTARAYLAQADLGRADPGCANPGHANPGHANPGHANPGHDNVAQDAMARNGTSGKN